MIDPSANPFYLLSISFLLQPMLLFEQFRSIVSLPNFSYLAPLPIIGCFLVSFRHWLSRKWLIAGIIYALSLCTGVAIASMSQRTELVAIGGGILAPAFYGLLFVCSSVIRILRRPYGHQAFPSRKPRTQNQVLRLLQGAFGGLIGGVTGSTLGALFSLCLIFLLSLPFLSIDYQLGYIRNFHSLIDGSILLFGCFGVGVGTMTGCGYVNHRQLGDRFLIGLTINLYVIVLLLKRTIRWKKLRSKR